MPATSDLRSTPSRPYGLWALLVLTVAAGFGVIAFPTLYIMPFKTQDARLLGWALTARTLAPTVTLVAAIVATILAVLDDPAHAPLVAARRCRCWCWRR